MRTGVTTSVIAHAALLILAIVGIGSAKPLEPDVVESIAVDLVPISDVTNIREGSLDSKVVETETPAMVETEKPAELAQPTGNTEKDQPTPEATDNPTPAPVVNTAPEPVPTPQPEPEPDPVKEPTPVPQPVAAPTPEPAPVETQVERQVATDAADTPAEDVAPPVPAMRPAQLMRAPAKPPPREIKAAEATPKKDVAVKQQTEQQTRKPDEQARTADQVAELINSELSRGSVTGSGGSPTLGKDTGHAATLSQSALDGLVAQIKTCMNVPPGAAEAGIKAQLHFRLDAGGNVIGVPDIIGDVSTSLQRALSSAAQRAVMRCGPYPMAVNQEIQATFDPRELT